MTSTLTSRAKHARAWLMESAFPFWLDQGLDRAHGGFHERLFRNGAPEQTPKRLRVQARQVYSCVFAGQMGWTGPWREGLHSALNLMLTKGIRRDGLFIHRFTFQSARLDTRADLYDQAFAIFALAQASAALNREDLSRRALGLWSTIDSVWGHPNGGFAEGEVEPEGRRRQNPHMHLFEAAMACGALITNANMRTRINALGQMFPDHFYDAPHRVVREFFTDDWQPATGDAGRLWEPGHSFEWVWLLQQWSKHGGPDNSAIARALYEKANAEGVDQTRNVGIDECWMGGGVKTAEARLWPQTERLKAALALGDHAGAAAAFDGLWLYISEDGFWADRMKADGTLIEESGPASSFYHILVALSELFAAAKP